MRKKRKTRIAVGLAMVFGMCCCLITAFALSQSPKREYTETQLDESMARTVEEAEKMRKARQEEEFEKIQKLTGLSFDREAGR